MYHNTHIQNTRPCMHPALTKREMEVMLLTCKEYSNKEIACEMKISIRTVETYKKIIMQKTGARNTVGIAMFAVKLKYYTAVVLSVLLSLLPDECIEATAGYLCS